LDEIQEKGNITVILELVIREGFSRIKIGDQRSTVRNLLSAFALKIHDREPQTDFYSELLLVASYSERECLEFVECAVSPWVQVLGKSLCEFGLQELISALSDVENQNPTLDSGTYIFSKICVGVKEIEGQIESICVFSPGYF
jgi:hypothetical protein